MFSNPGEKLRDVAIVTFIFNAIICGIFIIAGIVTGNFLICLITSLFILVSSFLTCLMLAAFGEISQNVSALRVTLTQISSVLNNIQSTQLNSVSLPQVTVTPASSKIPPVQAETSFGKQPAKTSDTSDHPHIDWDRVTPNLGKFINYKVYVPKGFATVICPWCKTEQPSGPKFCTICEAEFHYVDK